jgi:hypothetical protein
MRYFLGEESKVTDTLPIEEEDVERERVVAMVAKPEEF